jgi:hypothetical protein
LQCSFCPEVERPKKVMSALDFKNVLNKVKKSTEEITLHLMGEPLAHPEFKKIFEICLEEKVLVNLTTNCTHLKRYPESFFFTPQLKQINFSIHITLRFKKLSCHSLVVILRLLNHPSSKKYSEQYHETNSKNRSYSLSDWISDLCHHSVHRNLFD